jgi:hypothetical protein
MHGRLDLKLNMPNIAKLRRTLQYLASGYVELDRYCMQASAKINIQTPPGAKSPKV